MTCHYQQLPHEGITSLHPYVPGKSIEELAREKGISNIIKLASNENPLGCSPKVREALAKISGIQIATYPSASVHPLMPKLSQKLGLDEKHIMLSNGSDLLFGLLLNLFGLHNNKHILTHEKAFVSYSIQAQVLGIAVKKTPLLSNWHIDIDALISACNTHTALIFLANPNNPAGALISIQDIKRLLSKVPTSTIVVIDEAYYEYSYTSNKDSCMPLLNAFSNLVITRTFSKAYGLAGLRLGYAMANPQIIELLQRIQLPFAVNQVAMAAGLAALDDEAFLSETLAVNAEGLQQLSVGLTDLACEILPAQGNFITFDCKRDSLPVYQQLLDKGIIVRPLLPYHLPNHLRVSTGKPEHNERFLTSLADILI